ncbi:MAG: sigma-54-dependent Fis family transcriptional regulator [Acidobacteria bacterium]|nr:sigma-54-dependent Fis family transcriptional regulator [Acidobacteriota bacterium]
MEQNLGQHESLLPVAEGRNHSTFVEAVSPTMRALEAVIPELAHSSVPVLLIGEPGTGKRTIALRIHENSGVVEKPFELIDCHELSPQALSKDRLLVGTSLYLDEIGLLSLECQQKLFELISQDGASGGSRKQVRVICGSSQDLEAEVRAGNFREDLYYRLSGVCLRIPPLRQRKEDLPQLMSFFLGRYSQAFGRPIPELSTSTQKLFLEHSWPGNLTELEAAARAIVAVGDESMAMAGLRSLMMRSDRHNGEKTSLKEAARAASREAERELILKVLTRTRWNRRRAAQELQISYKALLYKLKQIGYGEYGAS